MRVFKDWLEAYPEILRDLKERGVQVRSHSVQSLDVVDNDDYIAHEITGYAYQLLNAEWIGQFSKPDTVGIPQTWPEQLDIGWATGEVEQRLKSGINPGSAWLLARETTKQYWKQWLNEDGKFDYTYSERMGDMFAMVCDELHARPLSRQVIIPIYSKQDTQWWGGLKRIPCSMYYQFLIRDQLLHLIYTMRSCDAYQHLPSDVFMALRYLQLVARDPRVIEHLTYPFIGHFYHFIGSLHVFQKDVQHVF